MSPALPDISGLVGMGVREASEAAKAAGLSARLVRVDGRYLCCTRDYRSDRVGLSVQGGIVYLARIG